MRKPARSSPAWGDIFVRLADHGIRDYGRIKEIVSFQIPQSAFFFAVRFGRRTLEEVLNQMERWKKFLKTDFLLLDNQRAEVKLVVASAQDDNGRQLYLRNWNHEFIDLPLVRSNEQNTPTLEPQEVSSILEKSAGRYRVLYALLAGTGMRIGEALAIRLEDNDKDHTTIGADCKIIHVRKSVWRGQEQAPKTGNAVRDIDVHPSLAAMLKEFTDTRRSGWLFQTRSGKTLSQQCDAGQLAQTRSAGLPYLP